jgi:hypothetical protein
MSIVSSISFCSFSYFNINKIIKSFIRPANAQLNCFKILNIYNKCSYIFRFNKTIIREPTVCASLKLQHWCQLIYFVIELFGGVAAYAFMDLLKVSGDGTFDFGLQAEHTLSVMSR